MSDYEKLLEKQNEELKEQLAVAEQRLVDTNKRMPRWWKRGDEHWYYGWNGRNLASIDMSSTDPDRPWFVWLAGEDVKEGNALRHFKTRDDAQGFIESVYSDH